MSSGRLKQHLPAIKIKAADVINKLEVAIWDWDQTNKTHEQT
jgi:hypothetical protein